MWLYYLIPIAVHILFLPFWFMGKGTGNTALIELVVGALIIPIYLIIISFKFVDKISMGRFVTVLLLMIGITVIGNLISYCNWGISTGKLLTPDSETVLIAKMQIIISIIVVSIGWIIASLIKSKTM